MLNEINPVICEVKNKDILNKRNVELKLFNFVNKKVKKIKMNRKENLNIVHKLK